MARLLVQLQLTHIYALSDILNLIHINKWPCLLLCRTPLGVETTFFKPPPTYKNNQPSDCTFPNSSVIFLLVQVSCQLLGWQPRILVKWLAHLLHSQKGAGSCLTHPALHCKIYYSYFLRYISIQSIDSCLKRSQRFFCKFFVSFVKK